MTSIILLILGATLVYAGVLMLERDVAVAFGSVVAGLLISVNPLLQIRRRFKPSPRVGKRPGLKVVRRPDARETESEREKPPTIH